MRFPFNFNSGLVSILESVIENLRSSFLLLEILLSLSNKGLLHWFYFFTSILLEEEILHRDLVKIEL